jgi:hypothetical protein
MTPLETLRDLLTVQALSQITPQRVQAWQIAARSLLADADAPPAVDAPESSPLPPPTTSRSH